MMDDRTIEGILKQLTLEEKARFCTGQDFWRLYAVEKYGLPAIMVTDGPHGLRKQSVDPDRISLTSSIPATCFPTASGLAATWNRDLIESVGIAIGEECRKENVSVLLGPGTNIKRHPLGGRNFEYFSEDPYLAGAISAAFIQGVQSQNVGTSLKHFAANNHEFGRMVVDVIVDDRTLREIYLACFEYAIKSASPWTIMHSYNKVNGAYLSENKKLLTDILRDEWGYDGLVMTDWGANNDRVAGVKAGQNLEMPYNGDASADAIIEAVNNGGLSMEDLDTSVRTVIGLILKAKKTLNDCPDFSSEAHHILARKAAEEACVLLKNDDQLLPFAPEAKIAVLGALAQNTRYQGAGSSQMNPIKLEQPLNEFRNLVGDKGRVKFAEGYLMSGDSNTALISQALKLAEESDKVILVAGLPPEYESEGFDRKNLDLPKNQLTLIEALRPVYSKLVIVLQNGSPVALPFANEVPAIIEAYLGGEAGASAMARILFGQANPSGKLAETFPVKQSDIPSDPWFPGEMRQSQYREGIWVGYRYYHSARKPVAFPFGHGLSYTTFEYRDLKTNASTCIDRLVFGESDELTLTFTVENTGNISGSEIAQVYVGQKGSSVPRPQRELKAFTKVRLDPGESKTVIIKLDYRSFAFWDVTRQDWVVESDLFEIMVGASVEDIRLSASLVLETGIEVGIKNPELECYFTPEKLEIDDNAFAALLGYDIPSIIPTTPYQPNSTYNEIKNTWLGRRLMKKNKKRMEKLSGGEAADDGNDMLEMMFNEMPIRNQSMFQQGNFKQSRLNRMIHFMNRDWIKFILGSDVKKR